MPRDYRVYLDDILQAIAKIREYTTGLSAEELPQDTRTLDAVVRNLEIIGEAAKSVPETIRLATADVEWKKISGLRDILIHQYFGVDTQIIWDIIQNKLPRLEEQIRKMLSSGNS
jgi:uncharacterized protein with HEPN domain